MAKQGGVQLTPGVRCKTAGMLWDGECPGECLGGENPDLEIGQKRRPKPERCWPAKEARWRVCVCVYVRVRAIVNTTWCWFPGRNTHNKWWLFELKNESNWTKLLSQSLIGETKINGEMYA